LQQKREREDPRKGKIRLQLVRNHNSLRHPPSNTGN
jgi:hypothetical protein